MGADSRGLRAADEGLGPPLGIVTTRCCRRPSAGGWRDRAAATNRTASLPSRSQRRAGPVSTETRDAFVVATHTPTCSSSSNPMNPRRCIVHRPVLRQTASRARGRLRGAASRRRAAVGDENDMSARSASWAAALTHEQVAFAVVHRPDGVGSMRTPWCAKAEYALVISSSVGLREPSASEGTAVSRPSGRAAWPGDHGAGPGRFERLHAGVPGLLERVTQGQQPSYFRS